MNRVSVFLSLKWVESLLPHKVVRSIEVHNGKVLHTRGIHTKVEVMVKKMFD